MTGLPLLDLHDLGNRQTGNESWARSLGAALFELDGPGSYDIAVSRAFPAADAALLPARETVRVSDRPTRRLGVDLPSAARRLRSTTMLVQYTAALSRVPTVVMVHDLSFESPQAAQWLPLATRLRYRATIRSSVRRAAHILTVSEFTKADLVSTYHLGADQVTVVPNAVDPRLADILTATPETRGDRPTVLMVGNVLPRKNLPVVARAVRLLRDRGQDVVLRVVGTVHPTGRKDEAVARAQLGADIAFTGYVSREDLARELRSAHVLAFPSLFEGFGIPALEAMTACLPVVVSDRTSLPEVVGDAGLVVPAEDPEAWAEALARALEPAVAADLVAAGARREAQFRWDRSAVPVAALLGASRALPPG